MTTAKAGSASHLLGPAGLLQRVWRTSGTARTLALALGLPQSQTGYQSDGPPTAMHKRPRLGRAIQAQRAWGAARGASQPEPSVHGRRRASHSSLSYNPRQQKEMAVSEPASWRFLVPALGPDPERNRFIVMYLWRRCRFQDHFRTISGLGSWGPLSRDPLF